jgi:plasmid stability protein
LCKHLFLGKIVGREVTMPNILVRDIDDRDLELLKQRAEASGRSLQAELKRVLQLAARASDTHREVDAHQHEAAGLDDLAADTDARARNVVIAADRPTVRSTLG